MSGIVEKAALGFLEPAALPVFAHVSKTLPWFSNLFVGNFLPASAEISCMFLESSVELPVYIVLSLTAIDFLLFHWT